MMKRFKKKWLSMILIIALIIGVTLPSALATEPDFLGGDYEIEVTVKYADANNIPREAEGIHMGVFRVALIEDGKNLTPEFYDANADLPDDWDWTKADAGQLRSLAESLEGYVDGKAAEMPGLRVFTNAEGIAVFPGLEAGVYLVMQMDKSKADTTVIVAPGIVLLGYDEEDTVHMEPKTVLKGGGGNGGGNGGDNGGGGNGGDPPNQPQTPSTPGGGDESSNIPDPDVPMGPADPGEPDTQIDDPNIPLDPMIPQTGIFDWQTIIIVLAILGVALIMVGLVHKKFSARKK